MRLLIAVVLLIAAPWPSPAQNLAPAPPAATLGPAEMEKFLLDGRIVKKKESSKGVTEAYRVTLSDGVVTHDAQVQNVDIAKAYFDVGPKKSEVNFKDSYRYNVAAYRLAVLLGLDNVPMSVERVVDGKPAAVTWWSPRPARAPPRSAQRATAPDISCRRGSRSSRGSRRPG